MRLKNLLFLTCILTTSLSAEKFGPYDLSYTHATPAGMASLGVGLNDPGSNLYSNPSLLASNQKYILDGGLTLSGNQGKYSPVKPLSTGFYVPVDNKNGWGATGKQTFYQNFPGGNDAMSNYTFSFFWTYKFSEKWNGSVGIGPSVVFRGGYQSSYSLSPTASLSYKNEKHLLGLTVQSPGKFRLEGYRGVDNLKERLPEYAAIGYSFLFQQTTIYSEVRKVFWERSSFDLNGQNSRPSLDRGLGAEVKVSLGAQHSVKDSPFQFRTGFELGGFYDSKGVNRRALGLAAGISWKAFTSEEDESLSLHLAIVNYSIFSKSGGRQPESILYLSTSYLF
jgi:hypothetical protein